MSKVQDNSSGLNRIELFALAIMFIVFNPCHLLAMDMRLSSPVFSEGGDIPVKYERRSQGGENISLPFEWKKVPARTKSFALLMYDADPAAKNFVHWILLNIPAKKRSIYEGGNGSFPTFSNRQRSFTGIFPL